MYPCLISILSTAFSYFESKSKWKNFEQDPRGSSRPPSNPDQTLSVSQAPQQTVRLLPKLWKQVGKAFGWSYRHILRNPNVGSTDPCLRAWMALTHLLEFNGSPWWQRGVAPGVCVIVAVTVVVKHRTSCSKHIMSDLHTLSHLNFTTDSYQYPLFKKRKPKLNNLPPIIELLAPCGTSCHHTVSLFLIGGEFYQDLPAPDTEMCLSHSIWPWDNPVKNGHSHPKCSLGFNSLVPKARSTQVPAPGLDSSARCQRNCSDRQQANVPIRIWLSQLLELTD